MVIFHLLLIDDCLFLSGPSGLSCPSWRAGSSVSSGASGRDKGLRALRVLRVLRALKAPITPITPITLIAPKAPSYSRVTKTLPVILLSIDNFPVVSVASGVQVLRGGWRGRADYCTRLGFGCERLPCRALHKHHEPLTDYCATLVIRRLSKAAKLQNKPYCARPLLLHKGAYVSKLTGPFVQQKPLFRVACFATLLLLWELTDSNRRPSACKADALNQLS